MNYADFIELNNKDRRTLKIWKIIIIVHGVCLFLMVYNVIFMFALNPSYLRDIPGFFMELFDEFRRYPLMILYYAYISVGLNLFTIPRLIALYRFIEAKVTGERVVRHVLFYILSILCEVGIIVMFAASFSARAHKPVIYLYPETKTEVNVKLELDGNLTVTYPIYNASSGWTVTAGPDGTLTDKNGRQYSYLYWEGDINIKPDLTKGFCVKGEDTAGFLEDKLRELGLNDKEAEDFITYWLPYMAENKYNVITFQTKAYEDVASLDISPKPDTVIRVNMLWYSSNTPVNIAPQDLTPVNPAERKGFTVVEWGGEEYKKGLLKALMEVK